jgi:ribosomal protein S18 acetylase RimI-like enzyme
MDDLPPPVRRATRGDAPVLAELIDMAGDGVPAVFWARMARPGETPLDVGRRRARRKEDAFSYRNALVIDGGAGVVAALLGYPLPGRPEPVPADLPAKFVPFQELENLASGTWYLNALATYPEHRRQGHGTRLLGLAEDLARAGRCRALSLAVVDANAGARRLYERLGFRVTASRPLPRRDWPGPGTEVLLMVRDLGA